MVRRGPPAKPITADRSLSAGFAIVRYASGVPDSVRRDLERRARQGDSTAQAAALVRRLRAGELDEERLRLAALVGDPAARLALGDAAPAKPHDVHALARALQAFGPGVVTRATITAVRAMNATVDPRHGWDLSRARQAIASAEAWLACPCEPHLEAARRVGQTGDEVPADAELAPAWAVIGPDGTRLFATEVALGCAAAELGEEAMRRGLRRALVGWALGG